MSKAPSEIRNDADAARLREMNARLIKSAIHEQELAEEAEHARDELRVRTREVRAARDYSDAILRTSPIPLVVLESDLRIVTANEAFCRKFKIEPEAAAGRHVYELGNGQLDIPIFRNLLEDVLPEKKAFEGYEVEYELDGFGTRTLLLNARRMEVEEGGPERIVLVMDDITERRMIEMELEAKEAELQLVTDVTPLVLVRCGGDLKYKFINRAGAALFGRKPSEIVGRPIVQMMGEEAFAKIEPYIKRVLSGESVQFEAEVPYPVGQRTMRANYEPERDGENNVIGWVASIMDITDRKMMENQLRESEARFSKFMQHLPGLAWIKDGDGRYVFANAAAERAFQTPMEDLVGKSDKEVFPPETAAAFIENDRKALRNEGGRQAVEAVTDETGVLRYSLVSKFPIPMADLQPPMVGGMAIDITEQKLAEKNHEFLFAIAEKVRLSRNAGELLADVASSLGKYLDVHRCLFNEIDLERDTEIVHNDYFRTGSSVAGTHKISEYSPITSETMISGQTVVNRDSRQDPRTAELFKSVYGPNNELAYVAVPLLREGEWVASLWCSDDKPHNWTDQEVGLLEGIAERVWSAVEKMRAEEARERLAAIVESSDDAIIGKDLNGIITNWNRGAEKVFGYSAEEAIGQPVTMLMPPERVDEEPGILRRIRRGESIDHYETVRRRKDGTLLDISLTVSPIYNATGKVVGASKVARDITASKRAEEALVETQAQLEAELTDTKLLQSISAEISHPQEAEALYDKILDAAVGIMRSDYASMQMYFPERGNGELLLLAFRGFNPEAAKSWEWVAANSATTCGEALRTLKRSIAPKLEECEFMQGTEDLAVYLQTGIRACQTTPLLSRNGDLVGMISTHWSQPHNPSERDLRLFDILARQASDLIERTLGDEALRKSEERYRTLFDSMDEGYCIIEVIFDEQQRPVDYRFIEVNSAFEKQSGMHDVVGKRMLEFVSDIEEHWLTNYGRVATTGEPVRFSGEYKGLHRSFEVYAFQVGEPTDHRVAVLFTDITERNLAEALLRDSEEKFRTFSNTVPALMWFDDPEGNCLFVNRAYAEFYGKPEKDLAGLGWHLVLHPDDADEYISSFQMAQRERGPFYGRARAKRHDGQWRWLESFARPLFSDDGAYLGHVGVSPDMTDSIEAEEALRKSEEKARLSENQLRLVTDSIPALVSYVGADQRYKFVNETYCDWFGLPKEKIVGKKLQTILGARAYRELKNNFDQALSGETVSFEANVHYKEAGNRFVSGAYVPDIDDDGNVLGFYALITDVSDLKRSEELLRSSQHRMQVLTESFTDYAIFSTDVEGRIDSWNPGAVNIFGYDEDEVLGRSYEMLFTPEDVINGVPLAEMRTARKGGRAFDERWQARKDGTRFFAAGVMAPLYIGNTLSGYAKITSDLTEKQRYAEALQQAHDVLEMRVVERTQELAAANAALIAEIDERKTAEAQKIEFLQRLVTSQEDQRQRIARDLHDQLGQRLTALRLKIAALREACDHDENLKARATRLQEISEILDSEVSFLAWELRPFALDELGLVDAIGTFVREWSKHYEIPAEFHTSGLSKIQLDKNADSHLYRIAQEALNNVVKHARATGVNVLLERTGEELVLIVEDDGVGMARDQTTNGRKGGKGLGLEGMRERASLIGATLEIESAPGTGTTIYARLPLTNGQ